MRTLPEIAQDILNDPALKGNARFYAEPYLKPLTYCYPGVEYYGADSVDMVVAYALSNLNYYRGENAKALKAELKGYLK